jgi:hypothetical protein
MGLWISCPTRWRRYTYRRRPKELTACTLCVNEIIIIYWRDALSRLHILNHQKTKKKRKRKIILMWGYNRVRWQPPNPSHQTRQTTINNNNTERERERERNKIWLNWLLSSNNYVTTDNNAEQKRCFLFCFFFHSVYVDSVTILNTFPLLDASL